MQIEIIAIRDPDASNTFEVLVNGEPLDDPTGDISLSIYDVDPGDGHLLSEWDEATRELCEAEEISSAAAQLLRRARDRFRSSEYVKGR